MIAAEQPKHVESYERFFGLSEPPFSLAPNPRFIFEGATHAAALGEIAYALERREPLVVITGEIGVGKTLLCRTLLQRLQRKTFLSVISDPQLERDDLLKQLLEDFGVISKDRTRLAPASRHDLFHALQAFLFSLVPIQAHAVVIVDEAQHLKPDVLEQIRLLSNTDDDRGTLLQIILVGQTDLEPLLARPELRQFQQRVSRRFRLEPLSPAEVRQYIDHRLTVARGEASPAHPPGASDLEREVASWARARASLTFTPEAVRDISLLSGGLPRVINIVCDRALELAYSRRTQTIDPSLVDTAARVVGLTMPRPASAAPVGAPTTSVPAMTPPPQTSKPMPTAVRQPRQSIPAPPSKVPRPVERSVPVAFGALARINEPPSLMRRALPVIGAVLAAAAIWLGIRTMSPPATPQPASTIPSPAPPQSVAEPAPPAAAPAPAPSVAAPPVTAPAPDAAPSSAETFEIVVASFRTDARAAEVAAQVTGLDVPVRRRVSDGWQQVLAGPFSSRAEAADAQQRLDRAGLTGTQIVMAPR